MTLQEPISRDRDGTSCAFCFGSGIAEECPECHGQHDVACGDCGGDGCEYCDQGQVLCPCCGGDDLECDQCNGTGEDNC